jgi:hypothetical protein
MKERGLFQLAILVQGLEAAFAYRQSPEWCRAFLTAKFETIK